MSKYFIVELIIFVLILIAPPAILLGGETALFPQRERCFTNWGSISAPEAPSHDENVMLIMEFPP